MGSRVHGAASACLVASGLLAGGARASHGFADPLRDQRRLRCKHTNDCPATAPPTSRVRPDEKKTARGVGRQHRRAGREHYGNVAMTARPTEDKPGTAAIPENSKPAARQGRRNTPDIGRELAEVRRAGRRRRRPTKTSGRRRQRRWRRAGNGGEDGHDPNDPTSPTTPTKTERASTPPGVWTSKNKDQCSPQRPCGPGRGQGIQCSPPDPAPVMAAVPSRGAVRPTHVLPQMQLPPELMPPETEPGLTVIDAESGRGASRPRNSRSRRSRCRSSWRRPSVSEAAAGRRARRRCRLHPVV